MTNYTIWTLRSWALLSIESTSLLAYLSQYRNFIFLIVEADTTISTIILETWLRVLIALVMAWIAIWNHSWWLHWTSPAEETPRTALRIANVSAKEVLDCRQSSFQSYANSHSVVPTNNTNRRGVSSVKFGSICLPFQTFNWRRTPMLSLVLLWLSCDLLPVLLPYQPC